MLFFVVLSSFLMVTCVARQPKKTEMLKRALLPRYREHNMKVQQAAIDLQKKLAQQQQELQQEQENRLVAFHLSRNFTGIGKDGVMLFKKDIPPLPPDFSMVFNVYLVPLFSQEERYRMLFLFRGSMGALCNGTKIKFIWNNEKNEAMELFVDLPHNIIQDWAQIGLDVKRKERLLDVYLNGKKLFYIYDFSTVDFDLFYMGQHPSFDREGCNCVFQNFVIYNHLIAQNETNINDRIVAFSFDTNRTEESESAADLVKKGLHLLDMDNLEGLELLHEARRMDSGEAMKRLGEINFFGDLLEPNFKMAHRMFEGCAARGFSQCLYYLSLLHTYGIARNRNDTLALFYLSLATALDAEMNAQFTLGYRYFYGLGVRKNHFVSNHYFKVCVNSLYDCVIDSF